jgi:hypothetical protein
VGGKESAERTQRMRRGAPVAGTYVEDPERSEGLRPAAMGPEARDAHPHAPGSGHIRRRAKRDHQHQAVRPAPPSVIVTGTDETRHAGLGRPKGGRARPDP